MSVDLQGRVQTDLWNRHSPGMLAHSRETSKDGDPLGAPWGIHLDTGSWPQLHVTYSKFLGRKCFRELGEWLGS